MAAGRRLAGALQADEHDHPRLRAAQVQPARLAQGGDQLLVDDLDDLLGRVEGLGNLRADRARADAIQEALDHGKVDVRLQQRQAHLAQRHVHVGFGELAPPRQLVKNSLQFAGKCLKHTGR